MVLGVLAEPANESFESSRMNKNAIEGIFRLMGQTGEKDMLARLPALEAAGSLVSACKDQSVIEKIAKEVIGGLDVDHPTCKHATNSFIARIKGAVEGQ